MSPRVRVKICGLTTADDALLAAELGADALGFIFVPTSPRALTPAAAGEIIAQLPPLLTPVAVVRNEPVEVVREILTLSGCRVVQLHGDEPPEYLEALGLPAMKAIGVAGADDLDAIARYRATARAVLLDTKVAGHSGGTGQTFDWQLARQAQRYGLPLVLAGGLIPAMSPPPFAPSIPTRWISPAASNSPRAGKIPPSCGNCSRRSARRRN